MAATFIKKRKKAISFFLAFLITGISLFFFYSRTLDSKDMTNVTPTLFVHGFKGGPGSFNPMIKRLERNQWGAKKMIYRVSANGELSIKGTIGNETSPFIQVIFKDNRATLASQTTWLQKVMKHLYGTYGIQQVNLIGHSMGGLASANFLVTNQEGDYPSVAKLVVMGSPFKGIDNDAYFAANDGQATIDLKAGSQALIHLQQQKNYLDAHTGVLAIAGVIDESRTDGLVSLSSALGIEDLLYNHTYVKKIFYGPKASHSGLHEHTGVDQEVAAFLWGNHHS